MDTLFRIEGSKPGATSVILVGVHGDESFGVQAVKNLLPLKITSGTVIVMIGNPKAVEANTRFIDSDLNRAFSYESTGYEAQRVIEVKKILDAAEVLLDIHGSFVPDTQPFAICEPNAYDIVRHLPIARVVSGFDLHQPGGTDYYMNTSGRVGICVECGFLGDPKAVTLAEETIAAFLVARGHIDGQNSFVDQEYDVLEGMYITKQYFTPVRQFADFEKVSKGEIVGRDGEANVEFPIDGFILFPKARNKAGAEAFVYGKAVTS